MLRHASYRLIPNINGLNLRNIPKGHIFKTNHHHHLTRRAMATASANLAAERFYADREPPYCSLNATKSWGQLTYVDRLSGIAASLTFVLQPQGAEVCPLHWTGILGRCSYHPRPMDTSSTELVRLAHSYVQQGWQARRLSQAQG